MAAGLGSLTPEDLARLFSGVPMGAPQVFTGTSGTVVPDQPAPQAGPSPMAVPLPPQRPAGLASPALDPRADVPAPDAVPIAGHAPIAAPAITPAPTKPADEPSFGDGLASGLSRFRANGGFDTLGAIGTGLLSSPTWSGGLGAGLQLAQAQEGKKAATDLARLKTSMEVAKFQRETAALTGNAALMKRAYPNLSDAEASAQGGNSAAVTEALKILRDPNHGRENDPANIRARAQAQAEGAAAGQPQDVYREETDGAGNVWSVNGRTGQRTVALQKQDDKSVSMIPEAERATMGLPPGAYQRDANGKVSPINQAGTTINMGAEKAQDATVGKGYGEYQLDLATKGRNAASTLNTLAVMEQAMSAPGFYSGLGAEQIKQANQLLGALGVKDPRAASGAEVFDALSNKVVLDGLGGSLGPGISNTDRDYIGRTAATLARSGEGNRALIGIARDLAQRQQAVAKLARDYAAKNGGRLDSGFDQALDDFAQANPLFPQAKAGATASPPNEPPKGAPAGARQAPDGNFYVADPRRPGKFLKVQ